MDADDNFRRDLKMQSSDSCDQDANRHIIINVEDNDVDEVEYLRNVSREAESADNLSFIVDFTREGRLTKNECELNKNDLSNSSSGTFDAEDLDQDHRSSPQVESTHRVTDAEMIDVTDRGVERNIAMKEQTHASQLPQSAPFEQEKLEQHYYIEVQSNGLKDYTELASVTMDNQSLKNSERWTNANDASGHEIKQSCPDQTHSKSLPFETPSFNSFDLLNYDLPPMIPPSKPLDQHCSMFPPPPLLPATPHHGGINMATTFVCRSDTPRPHVVWSDLNSELRSAQQTLDNSQESFDLNLVQGGDCMTSTPMHWPSSSQRSMQSSLSLPSFSSSYALSTWTSNSSMADYSVSTAGTSLDDTNSPSAKYPRVPNNTPDSGVALAVNLTLSPPPLAFSKFYELPPAPTAEVTKARPRPPCVPKESHNDKERKRRNRMNNACSALRELVPGITTKTDKATLLETSARYIYQLKQNMKPSDQEFVQ